MKHSILLYSIVFSFGRIATSTVTGLSDSQDIIGELDSEIEPLGHTSQLLPRGDNPRQRRGRSPDRLQQSSQGSRQSVTSRPPTAPSGPPQQLENAANHRSSTRPPRQQSSGQIRQNNRYVPRPRHTAGQTASQEPNAQDRQRRRETHATNPMAQNSEPIFNPFDQAARNWHPPSDSPMATRGRTPERADHAPSRNVAQPRPATAAAMVGPHGRIRTNNEPNLHPAWTQTAVVLPSLGSMGAHQRITGQSTAHAGARTIAWDGFAASRAHGSLGVSTYMSTGPDGRGCINCWLPGQNPVQIDVGPNTPNFRVKAQNAYPALGHAEIHGHVSGSGQTHSTGHNVRQFRKRSTIGTID